ncbi:MAG TPA: hypothetical protein VH639_24455 [Bryobacteraceae bacterium]
MQGDFGRPLVVRLASISSESRNQVAGIAFQQHGLLVGASKLSSTFEYRFHSVLIDLRPSPNHLGRALNGGFWPLVERCHWLMQTEEAPESGT